MIKHLYKMRILFAIVIFAAIIALVYAGYFKGTLLEYTQYYAQEIKKYSQQYYWKSVLFFCLTFISATFFCIPITLLLTVFSGYLFDVEPGSLYSVASATLGNTLLFLFVRHFSSSNISKEINNHIYRYKNLIKKHGYSYILGLQIAPFSPTLLINIAAALLPIKTWTFIWTTSLGILPSSVLYALGGQQLLHISSIDNLLSIKMFVGLTLLAGAILLMPFIIRGLYNLTLNILKQKNQSNIG